MSQKSILIYTSALLAVFTFSGAAIAQNVPQTAEEVIVTAQRFSSKSSKTPIAISALSGAELQKGGYDSLSTLTQAIPNLQIDANGTAVRISIRGVTSQDTTEKGDPSAAFMLDGIYLARSEAQNISFFDIERLEVLRGPQGTLYGRNTTAGVINLISKKPSQFFELSANGGFGNYNARSFGAVLNMPINDSLSIRAATSINKRDAFIINGQGTGYKMANNRDDASVRISALYKANDNLNLLLRADYSDINSINADIDAANFYIDPNSQTPVYFKSSSKDKRTLRFMPSNGGKSVLQEYLTDNHAWGIGGEVNWKLPHATLSYLGSRRYFERNELGNIILSSVYGSRFIQDANYTQDSHELRITSDDGGKFKTQGGLYYFNEKSAVRFTLRDLEAIFLPPYFAFPQDPAINTNSAIFAQTIYSPTQSLRIVAGARYSMDKKSRFGFTSFQKEYDFNPANGDFHFLNAAATKSDNLNWRLGVDFDINKDTFIYAALATGYKSGSFNDGCMKGSVFGGENCTSPKDPNLLFYKPETLTSYEIGLKTRFWNNRTKLEAIAFIYDYKNLQLTGLAYDSFGGPFYTTTNAAKAAIGGFELNGEIRFTNSDIFQFSAALLDARYGEYSPDGIHNWSGLALDRTPSWVYSFGYDKFFTLPHGQIGISAFTRFSANYYLSNTSSGLRFNVPQHHKSDLTLSYWPTTKKWNIQAFAKNIEDIVYPLTVGGGVAAPSEPRTFGIRWAIVY